MQLHFGPASVLLLAISASSPADVALPLSTTSVVRFADPAEGREALAARDAFFKALSPFDRQVRLKTDRDITPDEFSKAMLAEVAAWDNEEVLRITAIVAAIRPKLDPFRLPLPKTVLLVNTTGKEEGDAAYTRGSAIVLPRRIAAKPADALEPLLLHELFHIVSRHDRELRDRLYAILGFTPCGPISLPPDLEARRITNPDAPVIEHRIRLEIRGESDRRGKPGGSPVDAAPILLSRAPRYDSKRGGSLFDYMQFRLLVIESDGDRWRAKLKDGQPVLLDPHRQESYHEQIGRNTKYIIHPEEILADNFVHLVTGKRDVPTPRILDEMRKVLAQ